MRTLRSVLQALSKLPTGFQTEGQPLSVGMAAAIQAQRRREQARFDTTVEELSTRRQRGEDFSRAA